MISTRSPSIPTATCLAYVDALELTSLVGMVDPPRAESKQAIEDAQKAHIRVRMVTGDDVITGAAIAQQLGSRERRFSALSSPRSTSPSGCRGSIGLASSAV